MNHEEFVRLASRHIDGVATAEEQHQLDEHVRSCQTCMADVAESVAEADAAADDRLSTFAALRRRPFFRWWLGAAALFFLALFGWSELRLRAERENVLQLQANLERMTTENQRLFRRAERALSVAPVVAGPNTGIYALSGGEARGATARVFIDHETGQGCLFAHGLPPAKPSERYQLWAVPRDGSSAMRIATFHIGPAGDAATPIASAPPLQKIASLVLTCEAPTVPSPSAHAILRGTL